MYKIHFKNKTNIEVSEQDGTYITNIIKRMHEPLMWVAIPYDQNSPCTLAINLSEVTCIVKMG